MSSKHQYFKFFFEWDELFEELTPEEVGILTLAAMEYTRDGVVPKLETRDLRIVWKSMKGTIDRTMADQEAQSAQNSENGKKGGAPKGNQNATKQPKTSENNQKQPKTSKTTNTNTNTYTYTYTETKTSGGGSEHEAHTTDTTTTTAPDFDEILMTWNNQSVTRPIIKIGDSGKRHDRTEMAVAVAGGHGAFLNAIRSLKDQAYFQNRQKDGYKVEYDWFIDPENFQNVLEGKYAKSRDKFGDGWEVVEFG